jgi:hypothetical protein
MAKLDTKDLGFNQLPHYSTHAIEFFAEQATKLSRAGIPVDCELLICDLLKASIKFLLPDNGYLFADHDFKPSMFELLRLPYPVCALEYTATRELYAEGSDLTHADKRIALCFDPWQLPPAQIAQLTRLCGRNFLEGLPERVLAVMAVYEANSAWGAAVGLVLVDLEENRPTRLKDTPTQELSDMAKRVGIKIHSKPSDHGLPVTFVAFLSRTRLIGQSDQQAHEALYIDSLDEVRATYEFLAAINCSNVGTQEVPAPSMLNDKRKKKGKTPFYPYKVLDLSPAAESGSNGSGGSHAPPRAHLRRGHIRQLGERAGNKVLWINATMVNAKTDGPPVSTVYKVRT